MNAQKTGLLIYEMRTRKGLTQKELAEKCNVTDKAVSKWERGEGCPDVTVLPKLAEIFGIEVENLMSGEIPLSQEVSGKTIKIYNFRQPDRYSRAMQRALVILGDDICKVINQEFTALLNGRCEFSVGMVDQMVNIEFLRSIPKNCFFYDFDFANRGFTIEIDPQIAKVLMKQDFSKHAPNDIVPKIRMVWNSIPSQLAKENKKFLYGLVREGARAKDYETAIMWLSDCGLVYKIPRVNSPKLPLKAYEDMKAFKLFVHDTGLLGCMTGLGARTLIEGNAAFSEFKGALTEQFVLQQLKTDGDLGIYYYTNDRGSCEIDFMLDNGEMVIPLEVKAEENVHSKSLRTYIEKYPQLKGVRLSMLPYHDQDWMTNYPLYCVNFI